MLYLPSTDKLAAEDYNPIEEEATNPALGIERIWLNYLKTFFFNVCYRIFKHFYFLKTYTNRRYTR
jgi:hypothetical protein